jgi:hypothetical protein
MIISDVHRYLFIEIPLTGSWAIRKELCDYYGGRPILHKHASYPEFFAQASTAEKEHFVFATVRNPLDTVVSNYFKVKSNYKSIFTGVEALQGLRMEHADLKKYEYVTGSEASFDDYFGKYHHRPYSSMIDLSAGHLDFVIRFEHLQEDFTEVLRRLGIAQVRPVPVLNKTPSKKGNWQAYYSSDATIEQAKRVCGPFMNRWGYRVPADWGESKVSRMMNMEYRILGKLRATYLLHFRYNNSQYAGLVRRLRAYLFN